MAESAHASLSVAPTASGRDQFLRSDTIDLRLARRLLAVDVNVVDGSIGERHREVEAADDLSVRRSAASAAAVSTARIRGAAVAAGV